MANFVVNYASNPELITLIESKMRLAMYWGSRFAELVGSNYAKRMGKEQEVVSLGPGQTQAFIGAPIETVTGFMDEGGLQMLIPVLDRLTEMPGAIGDATLRGTEETARYSFRRVQVNRWRKAYAPPMGMQRQATKRWKRWLVADAQPKLTQHYADFMPSNFLSAVHYGFSRELIAPTANNGIGVTPISHPNAFVAGVGQVSYAGGRPGTAGYEASVEAAINGMNGANPANAMTVAFLRDFVQALPNLKIKPLVHKGTHPLYPVFMVPQAFMQLRKDPEYKTFVQNLRGTDMADHPLAHLGEAIIDGALIITDLKLWYAYTNAMGVDAGIPVGTVEYGPRPTASQRQQGWRTGNTISQLDRGNVAVCIALGASALTIATGEELTFHEDIQDYDGVLGVGYDNIKSVVRNETFNTLGLIKTLPDGIALAKDAFYENFSSAIGFTWSPYAPTFGA